MKQKIEIEYNLNCSPSVLFPRLSTPSGLSEWFTDNVNIKDNVFTFYWDESTQKAELLSRRENQFIRFHWLDDDQENTYFEFKIVNDELTGDLSLVITDFIDEEDKEDAIKLWNSQVSTLKHCIGV